ERFVRNMTAGVHGIDLALLVVAADDGPIPQTREHLAILGLLGAPRLAVVLTKIDRASAERVDEAAREVEALLAPPRFGGAPLLRVSSVSGEGIPELRRFLESSASERATGERGGGRVRMHVDRASAIDGLGRVVAGTALSGAIGPGDAVRILPGGRTARVRSVRANSAEAARARAGERCALALQGLARGEVERGDTVVDAEGPVPSARRLDVTLERLSSGESRAAGASERSSLKRARSVTVFLGTASMPAQLTPLGEGFARLAFAREVCAWQGERYLVREAGSQRLLGGGAVVDPAPPERGAAKPERLAFLRAAADAPSAEAAFDMLLALEPGLVDLD